MPRRVQLAVAAHWASRPGREQLRRAEEAEARIGAQLVLEKERARRDRVIAAVTEAAAVMATAPKRFHHTDAPVSAAAKHTPMLDKHTSSRGRPPCGIGPQSQTRTPRPFCTCCTGLLTLRLLRLA